MLRKRMRQSCPFILGIGMMSFLGMIGPGLAADRDLAGCERPKSLRFSFIPVGNVDEHIRQFDPLLRRIAAKTGITMQVIRPSSYGSVVEGLLGRNIDIAKLGPAGYVEATEADRSVTAFATIEKLPGHFQRTGPYYHALLIALAGSGYDQVGSLKGKRLALTDPGSTSGAILPRKRFAPTTGASLEAYFATVSFSGGHAKSIDGLLRGDFDAAFLASTQLEDALKSGKLSAERVRILWTSEPIPFDPFVFRSQICASLRRQIASAFFDNDAEAALQPMLENFLLARRFVPIGDKHYEGIRSLLTGQ